MSAYFKILNRTVGQVSASDVAREIGPGDHGPRLDRSPFEEVKKESSAVFHDGHRFQDHAGGKRSSPKLTTSEVPNLYKFMVMVHRTNSGVICLEIPAHDATGAMSQVMENEQGWPEMISAYKIGSVKLTDEGSQRSKSRWR